MLELNQLRFAYPAQSEPYLFDLKLMPGEIVSIAGVSGSGKSTLLDLIAGFQTPLSGDLHLDGHDMRALSPEQRPVAILFQENNLFEHLSAKANLMLALKKLSKTEKHTKIEAALAAVGLSGFENRRTSDLSGGQKQRVALARTLLLNRKILLLDEPFSALDTASAQSTRQLVKDLVKAHLWHTILVTHHDEDHAIADQRMEIIQGQLKPLA